MTETTDEAPLNFHFRHTQLQVCWQWRSLTFGEPWMEILPDGHIYVGLEVHVAGLPTLRPQHITIGTYDVTRRLNPTKLLEHMTWLLSNFFGVQVSLEPYGRGYHWQLRNGTFATYVLGLVRADLQQRYGLSPLWEPDLHVSWHSP